MDPRPLLKVHGSAPLMLLRGNQKTAAEMARGCHEADLAVRLVRGHKSRAVDGLFDEFAAALQFPYYFGANWAAFAECLADMDWLPPHAGIVVVVLDAEEILSDEPAAELGALVRAVTQAAETYAEPIDSGEWWDRPAVPFHVVLQAQSGEEESVKARWAASGVTLSVLI